MGFRERFFSEVLRDSFAYVSARDHEHPYPERLKAEGRMRQRGLAARGSLANAAKRLMHGAMSRRRDAWVEDAARGLAEAAGRLERLEAAYDVLADEPSRELFVKLLEFRILGPRRVPLPVSPDRYREGLERVHRELLREPGTREVQPTYFPLLNRYSVDLAGREVAVETDETCMHDVFVLDEYAYEQGPVRVRAEPGDVVLDGGGGYGETALWFSSLVAPGGEVLVVEMDPRNRRAIARNLELNPELAARARVLDATLWESSGASMPYVAGGKMSRLVADSAVEGGTSQTTTLDDLLERRSVQRLDFLKLDVEGSELPVLKGATRTLEQLRPKLAIAVYHDPTDITEIPLYIDGLGLGYRFFLDHTSPGGDETVLFAAPPAA